MTTTGRYVSTSDINVVPASSDANGKRARSPLDATPGPKLPEVVLATRRDAGAEITGRDDARAWGLNMTESGTSLYICWG